MEKTLHEVTGEELPTLESWLGQFLPESCKLYCTVRETIRGRWEGTTFYTLGWPNILAVGEGQFQSDNPELEAHLDTNLRVTAVFSPSEEHLKKLLGWPGFFNWTKPILFQVVPSRHRYIIEQVSKAYGGNLTEHQNILLEGKPETMHVRPIPEGFELRPLDPDLHTDYACSTWIHCRTGTEVYVRELIRRFPSVGLFDTEGNCIGLEINYEFGTMGMLHVREEFRGRGLGKVITTHMARKLFEDGLPVYVNVLKDNEASLRMHVRAGMEDVGRVSYIFHHLESTEEFCKQLGFTDAHSSTAH